MVINPLFLVELAILVIRYDNVFDNARIGKYTLISLL